jgi:hypothetical protein
VTAVHGYGGSNARLKRSFPKSGERPPKDQASPPGDLVATIGIMEEMEKEYNHNRKGDDGRSGQERVLPAMEDVAGLGEVEAVAERES